MDEYTTASADSERWYNDWFQEDYLLLYRHRDDKEARDFLDRVIPKLVPMPVGFILDLACGAGRHSHYLYQKGFPVVGLDLSRPLLKQASSTVSSPKISWIRGDMRQVPLQNRSVSAVFNLFTSFGYFPKDSDDASVLREVLRVLIPGGWFVLDTLNPSFVESNLEPMSQRRQGDVEIFEERRIDHTRHRVVKTIALIRDGQKSFFMESVRMYQVEELQQLMQSVGLESKILWGDYQGNPYQEQSSRIIIVAQAHADDPL
jgi:SAM-dependent methyltransferase